MSNRIACAALLALTAALLPGVASAGRPALPDFTELVKANTPAVVNISTTRHVNGVPEHQRRRGLPDLPKDHPFRDFFDRFFDDENGDGGNNGQHPSIEAESLGSGFVISDDGYILTNQHVVRNASEIVVRLSDRREFDAELVGVDARSDLALLDIDARSLPVVSIGRSSALQSGEWVLAIGSPFGFEHSVTAGIVSATGRSLPRESYIPFIQTDVAINPGNSGGPLINLDGRVVGINSHIYSRTGGFMGVSFAIPIELAMDVANQLKRNGEVVRGWLGVLLQDVTVELADSFDMRRPHGALVAQVLEGSPAAAAGLQAGDVILRFNDQPIETSSKLPPIVGRTPIDDTVPVAVIRDGERKTLNVTIRRLPKNPRQASRRKESGRIERLGLSAKPLGKSTRDALGLDADMVGIVVTDVGAGPAGAAGVQTGDVITRVDRMAVEGVDSLRRIAKALKGGRSVPVLVRRGDGPRFLALRVPAR